jgi:hypothetical protein
MAKFLLPKLWASTIPSIWTYRRPNSGQGARRYDPEMSAAHTSPKSDRLSSEAVLRMLPSFPRKAMTTKVEDNFVAHNQDTGFAIFGVRTWDIWCLQGRATN